jgi:hypothetical protein
MYAGKFQVQLDLPGCCASDRRPSRRSVVICGNESVAEAFTDTATSDAAITMYFV